MKLKIIFIFSLILYMQITFCQQTGNYSTGYAAEKNLETISNISPYGPGGIGFDNRYEGVKGSKRLFDTLYTSLLRMKGEQEWMSLEADMDVVENRLIFAHPKTGALMSAPADVVDELVVNINGREDIYRTTEGMDFAKRDEGIRFCQVLYDSTYCLIKVPYKQFIAADYKQPYGPQRTYDEYQSREKYYIRGPDRLFYQVALKRKSLLKQFPGQKGVINSFSENEALYKNDEEFVVALLRKFR
jgi:hypothetical protein